MSLQYNKTVTCNISVSASFECTVPFGPEMLDLPFDIARKVATRSFHNPTWHSDVDKQFTTAISCNISETPYFCQKLQL